MFRHYVDNVNVLDIDFAYDVIVLQVDVFKWAKKFRVPPFAHYKVPELYW